MQSSSLSLGVALALLAPAALAQPSTIPQTTVPYRLDSGYLDNPGLTEIVIFRGTVTVNGKDWLRIDFESTNLPGKSRLRLTSLMDRAVQWFDAGSLRDYANSSAYFNGESVLVELLAAPRTRGNRVNVVQVVAGSAYPIGTKTICGPTDDRVPSEDPRCGRLFSSGCTGWLMNPTTVLTAGHCSGSSAQQIHFRVPFSTSSGGIRLPPPQHQYPFDMSTQRRLSGGVGADWTVVATVRNSNTGLYAGQGQRAWYNLGEVPGQIAGQNIRITGYGTTAGGVPRTWNQIQKTHVGPLSRTSGRLSYRTDTTGGNSGSPVIHDNTGAVIGIHTHGGCTSGGGANSGTRIDRSDLKAAIAAVSNLKAAGLYSVFGSGCAGSAGTPTLSSLTFPDLGNSMTLDVTGVAANQTGVMIFGSSDSTWNGQALPLNLGPSGMAGCSLLVGLDIAVPLLTGASGTPSMTFGIPVNLSLVRQEFFNQYTSMDPGANLLGVTWSNGGKAIIGE